MRLRSLPSAEASPPVRCGVDTAQGERQHAKADQRGRGSPLSCRGSIPTNAKSLSTASAAHRRAAVASSVLMASRCDEQLQNVVSKRSDPLVLAAIGEGGVQIAIVQSPPPLPAPRIPPGRRYRFGETGSRQHPYPMPSTQIRPWIWEASVASRLRLVVAGRRRAATERPRMECVVTQSMGRRPIAASALMGDSVPHCGTVAQWVGDSRCR